MAKDTPFIVAIVGGGPSGLILALSLARRGIPVQVYEQSQNFRHIGAGIGISAVTRACLRELVPEVLDALPGIVGPQMDKLITAIDAYHETPATRADPEHEEVWVATGTGPRLGFWPCHRAAFMDLVYAALPADIFQLRRRFVRYEENAATGRMDLFFEDGSVEHADAVVGCDGIKSRTRQIMFGESNPVSYAHYTHKYSYRAVMPMDQAVAAMGKRLAMDSATRSGPGGHLIHYPIANGKMVNALAYQTDPAPWPDREKMSLPADKADLVAAFKDWNSLTRRFVNALDATIDRYAVFDMADHPAPHFNQGRVCLIGDAAHATSPNLGSGAGFGIEDALAMVAVLEEADRRLRTQPVRDQKVVNDALCAAFEVFNSVRHARGLQLVAHSRVCGEILDWTGPSGSDAIKGREEMTKQLEFILELNVPEMVTRCKAEVTTRLGHL